MKGLLLGLIVVSFISGFLFGNYWQEQRDIASRPDTVRVLFLIAQMELAKKSHQYFVNYPKENIYPGGVSAQEQWVWIYEDIIRVLALRSK